MTLMQKFTKAAAAAIRFAAESRPASNPRRLNWYGHFKRGRIARKRRKAMRVPTPGAFGDP
jgi:hypothetical protein